MAGNGHPEATGAAALGVAMVLDQARGRWEFRENLRLQASEDVTGERSPQLRYLPALSPPPQALTAACELRGVGCVAGRCGKAWHRPDAIELTVQQWEGKKRTQSSSTPGAFPLSHQPLHRDGQRPE